MNTISIHISENTSKSEVEQVIKKNKIKKGDTVKIYRENLQLESFAFFCFLMIIAYSLLKKTESNSIENLFAQNKSTKEIEKLIKEKAGVQIDVEEMPKASTDPIEGVFGIWKNRKNFDREKFRNDAWRKIN